MKPPKRRWLFLGAGVLGLAAGVIPQWLRLRTEPAADGAVQTLLSQSFPDPQGNPVALAQFASQPLVINFWATWCAPCVEEMPELSQIAQELRPLGLQVLGIGVDSQKNIAEFQSKLKVDYPLVAAGAAGVEILRQFGNPSGALPFTVLVGKESRIEGRLLGRFVASELKSRAKALTSS
jgi:thiol-disulfide isomerase/thioredoxin